MSPARWKTRRKKAVVGQVPGHGHRDGPLVVDLTALAALGVPPQQGLEVHPDHHRAGRGPVDEGARVGHRLTVGCAAGTGLAGTA